MRQNDYERYRRFCCVKIQRIRKRIGFLNKHGKQYQKMDFTAENVIDAEALFYPLLNAERAWAMSRELAEEFGDTHSARVHHHCSSRNKKAVSWAEKFNQLCHQLADERTALESDAYLYFIKGVDRMDACDYVSDDTKGEMMFRNLQWSYSFVRKRCLALSAKSVRPRTVIFSKHVKKILNNCFVIA